VLGMTKRAAEQIISALHGTPAGETSGRRPATKFIAVRFGNVFGSNGSVATIFQAQIEAGGPVTITDRRMTRYFMTVAEAVDLVIMSAADAASRQSGDDYAVYMLDMGKPVPILEVAETMIRLSGKSPYKDVAIRFTGIRPGEKLHETLHGEDEELVELGISKIFGLSTDVVEWSDVQVALTALQQSAKNQDKAAALAALAGLDRAKKARASARQDAIPKTAGQAT
ncbi:polysaccharide biosynthesis protein, partial [Mesorhizobium sp. M7A.F.Ca.AU.002.03.1.1]